MERSISTQEWNYLYQKHRSYSELGNPALYVGTYAKYNNGSIYGMWVDLTTFDDYNEFIEFCKLLHEDERDPELMFQDFEGFPEEWYSECGLGEDTFDLIVEYAALSNDDKEMVDAYASMTGERDIDAARERHCGAWDSEEDFAEHIFDECYSYDMPEFARRYFDMAAFARDLFIDDYTYCDGHVFQAY